MTTATPERRVKCFRFTTSLNFTVRVAVYPVALTMSNGEVYLPFEGVEPTDRSSSVEGGASVIDLGSIYDADAITKSQVESGLWNDASVHYFATDWAAPVEDEEPIDLFTVGRVNSEDERYTVELMGLKDKLNQTIGRRHTAACGKVFTDNHIDGEIITTDALYTCGIDPVGVTRDVTITSVTSDSEFACSSLNDEVDDYYGGGELMFLTGNNGYQTRKIITEFTQSTGTIKLSTPLYYSPEVGDSVRVRAGCRKRHSEDCVNKWANGVNFGGKPHVPTQTQVTKIGQQG